MNPRSVNQQLAAAWLVLLGVPIIGLNLISVHWPTMSSMEITLALLLATCGPLALYLRTTKYRYVYLCFAAISWTLLAPFGSWFSIALAERLRITAPLMDYQLASLDRWLGIDIPAIHAWAQTHRLGIWINETYDWQDRYEFIVVVVSILFGEARRILRLNVAFTAALFMALPTALFYPAVGPWYLYHLRPDIVQQYVQDSILGYRASGGAAFLPIGILVCPSFHAIIALLNAWTMWGIKWLRVPAAVVSASIVLSTITTASHYSIDVIMGIGITIVSIALAIRLERGSESAVGTAAGEMEIEQERRLVPPSAT